MLPDNDTIYTRIQLNSLEDYFKTFEERGGRRVYMCRLDSWGGEIENFLRTYLEKVKVNGVYLKSRIANPDEKQLAFYDEIAGLDFKMERQFLGDKLKLWLPRLVPDQRERLLYALERILLELKAMGKNENMLRNAYIKFMCWFYYKFERILIQTGKEQVPKILYEGENSDYELKVLRILSEIGCDVVMVEKNGDAGYKKLDPDSKYSQLVVKGERAAFPENFSSALWFAGPGPSAPRPPVSQRAIQQSSSMPQSRPALQGSSAQQNRSIQLGSSVPQRAAAPEPAKQEKADTATGPGRMNIRLSRGPGEESRTESSQASPVQMMSGPSASARNLFPQIQTAGDMGTNIWLSGDIWKDSLKKAGDRGDKKDIYYNLFVKIKGAEDKNRYESQLLKWKLKLSALHRKSVLVQKVIPMPAVDEVQKIRRGNYTDVRQMMSSLIMNLAFPRNKELEKLIHKAFTEVLGQETDKLQIITNRAVCMTVWLNRYIPQLFEQWKLDEAPVFIYYGSCKNDNEAMFVRILSRIPVDVMVISPDLEGEDKLKDSRLFEKVYENSLPLGKFPEQLNEVTFQTAAYNAEQDLNSMMYEDTGIYRNRQFKRAIPVPIHTTVEEIKILWKEEAKYRPDFEVLDDRVMLPVIFSKISGVQNGDRDGYWQEAAKLLTPETFLIKHLPYITPETHNPIKKHVVSFLKNGKLAVNKIKQSPAYQYGFIREDMQDYMFDKLQQLLDSRIITGTFTQGVEYTILAVALNLNKEILRWIQKFDFTKEIPKVVLVNTTEALCSLEDSIMIAFLSMLGFDVLLLIPTGYQSVERFYCRPLFTEHQAGDYIYDMTVPDLYNLPTRFGEELLGKIFRRGR